MGCGCGPSGCNAHKRDESFDPDFEGPSDDDVARFGGDGVECPECGAEVYYDAPACHACGHAMMAGDGARSSNGGLGSKRNVVIAVGAAAALVGFVVVSML